MRKRLFAVAAVIAAAAAAGAAAIAFAGGDPVVTCEARCDSFTIDWTNGPPDALQFDVDKVVGEVVITGLFAPGARAPFDIYAFNWGLSQTSVPLGGGGGGAGKAEFQALSFVKAVDALSPLFARACATGVHVPHVHVELPAKDGTMNYELEDASCALNKHTAAGKKHDFPIETVAFSYRQITWIFSPRRGEDTRACFNLVPSTSTC